MYRNDAVIFDKNNQKTNDPRSVQETDILLLHLSQLSIEQSRAKTLGLLTFIVLLARVLIQPAAGVISNHLRPLLVRKE
jgi:hypothetical protein